VATFVGTSNIIKDEWAERLLGQSGNYTIRPEKIHLLEPDTSAPPDNICVVGTIQEVFYLGVNTRYIVALDGGGSLTVLEQNLRRDSSHVTASNGRRVALVWQRGDIRTLRA
jgi:putative spermidine/putrescine transport system ATP-binding protein